MMSQVIEGMWTFTGDDGSGVNGLKKIVVQKQINIILDRNNLNAISLQWFFQQLTLKQTEVFLGKSLKSLW